MDIVQEVVNFWLVPQNRILVFVGGTLCISFTSISGMPRS